MFNLNRLKNEFDKTGMNYSDMDRKLGYKSPLFYRYMSGYRNPSPRQLYQFLMAMGWSRDRVGDERLGDWYLT